MNASSNQTRARWLSVLLLATALLVLLWCWSQLRTANRRLDAGLEGLAESEQIVSEIGRLAARPRMASLDLESPQEMLELVSASIRQSGLPANSLVRVSPSEATRIGSSEYQQRQTRLQLRNVTLATLAAFHQSVSEASGLYLQDVVLSTDPTETNASNTEETWNARLTLTQIIYSPTSQ